MADDSEDLPISREIALSDRNLNTSLAGTSLAIFTFLFFFLYNRATSGEINPVLFQVSLGVIVAAIFSFAFSGLYNYVLVFSAPTRHHKVPSHRRRAEAFFQLGLFMLLSEPTLILFALGFVPVALASLVFILLYLALSLYESRRTIRVVRKMK